jgi:8-oxo-dGTP diphosphatase
MSHKYLFEYYEVVSKQQRSLQLDFFVYVDTVVFTINPDRLLEPEDRREVLVMKRPGGAKGKWALPGGLVDDNEKLELTSIRKVKEETGLTLKPRDLHQVGTYGDPDRDNRFRAIAIAYMALVPHPSELRPIKYSDAASFVSYRSLRDGRLLEFDHSNIIYAARKVARSMLEDTNVALSFCKPKFTMTELRKVYESFLQYKVDPANFRRKVDAVSDFILPLDEFSDFGSSPGRPAQMYRAGKADQLSTQIRFRRTQDKVRPSSTSKKH